MGSLREEKFRFCIDRGGTFTDIYAEIPGHSDCCVMKLLSVDPSNYDDAPVEGIRRILEEFTGDKIPRSSKMPTEKIEWIRMRLQDNLAPLAAFGLRGREHQMGPAGFGFGMPQHGLVGIGMGGMSSMVPMKMPSLPPAHFLRQDVDGRFLMPKGEPKESSSSESGLIMSRAAAVYHQMSRMPLGPQL